MGCCKRNRGRIETISRADLRVRENGFATVMKHSNSKGSALLRLVKKLSEPSSNGM